MGKLQSAQESRPSNPLRAATSVPAWVPYWCSCGSTTMRKTSGLVSVLLLLCPSPTAGRTDDLGTENKISCPVSYMPYDSSCCKFLTSTTALSWLEAQLACAKDGGSLATIRSAEENHFVTVLPSEGSWSNAWIGAQCNGGDWKWAADGLKLEDSYTNFDITTPSTGCQAGSCLVHGGSSFGSTWKMVPCQDAQTGLICQHPLPPEPSPPPTSKPTTPPGLTTGIAVGSVGAAAFLLFVCVRRGRRQPGRKMQVRGGLGSVRLLKTAPSSPARMELRGLGPPAHVTESPGHSSSL
jgi:hypothetical protein